MDLTGSRRTDFKLDELGWRDSQVCPMPLHLCRKIARGGWWRSVKAESRLRLGSSFLAQKYLRTCSHRLATTPHSKQGRGPQFHRN